MGNRLSSRISPLIVVALLLSGCGGSNNPSPPPSPSPSPSPSDGVQVRGSERVGWSQQSDSTEGVGYRFEALVDEARAALADVRCSATGGSSGYDCTAPLPSMSIGRHTLRLVAIDGSGAESAPSEALVLNVTGAQMTAVTPPEGSAPVACEGCSGVEVLAQDLGRVDRLATLPDGGVLIVHEDAEILMLRGGSLVEAIRLRQDGSEVLRFADLAVDPLFERNAWVFAAVVHESAPARRSVSIVRMREAGGRLGEVATIVPEIPLAAKGSPAVAIGRDGHLYLSMPAADENSRSDPYDGTILRFRADGAAAGEPRLGSPVLAHGVGRPGALAWDPPGRLWISSTAGDAARALASLRTDSEAHRWPEEPSRIAFGVESVPRDGGVSAIGFAAADAGDSIAYLLAGTPRQLFAAAAPRSDPATLLRPRPIDLAAHELTALATTSRGDVIVAAVFDSGVSAPTMILRLQPNKATRK